MNSDELRPSKNCCACGDPVPLWVEVGRLPHTGDEYWLCSGCQYQDLVDVLDAKLSLERDEARLVRRDVEALTWKVAELESALGRHEDARRRIAALLARSAPLRLAGRVLGAIRALRGVLR